MSRTCLAAVVLVSACGAQQAPLVSAKMITDDAIERPFSALPGDATRGENAFASRDIGHCILCHRVGGLSAEFQGDIGPDLSTVGDRLSAGQLRLRIADYQLVSPGALMPSYFRIHDLNQVGETYTGETILSAQQIEDIIAYLVERRADDHES